MKFAVVPSWSIGVAVSNSFTIEKRDQWTCLFTKYVLHGPSTCQTQVTQFEFSSVTDKNKSLFSSCVSSQPILIPGLSFATLPPKTGTLLDLVEVVWDLQDHVSIGGGWDIWERRAEEMMAVQWVEGEDIIMFLRRGGEERTTTRRIRHTSITLSHHREEPSHRISLCYYY